MKRTRTNRKGFTLVELMVVVVIIGILTAIAIPVYMNVTANAQKSACLANQRTIDSALMMYSTNQATAGTYPTKVSELVGTLLADYPVCPSMTPDNADADATATDAQYGISAAGTCTIIGTHLTSHADHALHG